MNGTAVVRCACGTSTTVTPRSTTKDVWPMFEPYRCTDCQAILRPTDAEWAEILLVMRRNGGNVPGYWWSRYGGIGASSMNGEPETV